MPGAAKSKIAGCRGLMLDNPKILYIHFKKAVQICLDADVLAWFKGYGKGYQRRINAALREVLLRATQGQT
jgi:uncharacterized protein (DUF4415 family)